MRRWFLLVALVVAACGGGEGSTEADGAPVASSATTTSVAPDATTTTSATTTTTLAPDPPAVLAVASGRGDDDTFEATVWFASDPFATGDYRIVVGADVDGGYPGVGDPFPFLNGHLEITPDGAALMLADEVLAAGDDLTPLVSWGYADGALRVFFIDTTPARGGTTWAIVEVDGDRVAFGTAGAPFGTSCSYHSAGTGLDATGVPDAGSACRYP